MELSRKMFASLTVQGLYDAARRGANRAQKGGICVTHGTRVKQCSQEGCANGSKKGGVCITHGATKKRCSIKGCANGSKKRGVYITHGAWAKCCSDKGCTKQARKGGLCHRHGKYSIASAAQNRTARPPPFHLRIRHHGCRRNYNRRSRWRGD